jgi:HK97 family phage major capsid protein
MSDTQGHEFLLKAQGLMQEAEAVYADPTASAEAFAEAEKKVEEVKTLKKRASRLIEAGKLMNELNGEIKRTHKPGTPNMGFPTLGHFVSATLQAGNMRRMQMNLPVDPRLMKYAYRTDSKETERFVKVHQPGAGVESGWGTKDLGESVGSAGGFLVPEEFLPDLYGVGSERTAVRSRATVIPMSRRSIRIPVLDQTGTSSNAPNFFGGIQPVWTEEATSKDETDPSFRQIELVAHKLTCYTEVSDELVEDAVISFDAFLRGPLGFAGAIAWTEEYAFLQGTGTGQPLGVLNAGATITVNRQADGEFRLEDAANMLESFLPSSTGNAVWMMSQSAMSELITMNGPAGNPSYVFVANASAAAPMTLLGYPIIFTEKLPVQGSTGDVLLADWSYYLIGDRKEVTIESTNVYKFQTDQTSWRAVHRVDGQPWLSQPLTLADGTSQVSPFVILGEKAS